jgi:hypothetical protein
MDKQKLDQLEAELTEIISLERVMKYSSLNINDVMSLQTLANRGIPRAEFLYGVYKLTIERNRVEGYLWLKRCKRHCNEIYLKKIAYIVKIIPMWGKYGI